tara:strand:+ start:12815 stop:13444 length:630 start_codon:yes stop_codon:yes gene_type:complete
MHQFNLFLSSLLIFFSSSLISEYLINITFESDFQFKSQGIFIKELKNSNSKRQIENILKEQDWIKNYSLVFKPFKKEVYLSIVNRDPVFVLNNEFFYDIHLYKFKFDNSNRDLIKVTGPVNDERNIIDIIKTIESVSKINFDINEIVYSYVSGWEVATDKTLIRFGKDLTKKKLQNFKDTSNYLFEIGKIPSIIDMRYKDGVAINYGKQ